ncbi:hypothetical protein, partial [Staphylococcus aureus]
MNGWYISVAMLAKGKGMGGRRMSCATCRVDECDWHYNILRWSFQNILGAGNDDLTVVDADEPVPAEVAD